MLRPIVGVAQHYSWGDHVSIPQLLGLSVDGNSWAEMWFGTHHVAPSHLDAPDGPALSHVAGNMDMLVKLLAAGQPLSLQTHPTKNQAEQGFARENTAGVDITAPHRMYKDASDKPEVLIALTPFEALCGFQEMSTMTSLLTQMGWSTECDVLVRDGVHGYLQWCFTQTLPPPLEQCPQWLISIAEIYPNDPGLRVAPLLHHVTLSPGQAIVLPAGNLHAYIKGCGLEVMNSSDNVVRAGFTTKHIDVRELLSLVDTRPLDNPVVTPDETGLYPSPSDAFSIQHIISDGIVQFSAENTHRVIFGPVNLEHTLQKNGATVPAMYFLAAGTSGELPTAVGDSVWVCRQN